MKSYAPPVCAVGVYDLWFGIWGLEFTVLGSCRAFFPCVVSVTHTYVVSVTHTYVVSVTHTYVVSVTHTYVVSVTHTYVYGYVHPLFWEKVGTQKVELSVIVMYCMSSV